MKGENMKVKDKLMKKLKTRTKQQTLFLYALGWIIIFGIDAWMFLSGQIVPGIILCGGILFLIVGLTDIIKAYQAGYQLVVKLMMERETE